MAEHTPHGWAPSISCVPTTHRLWLAPAPLRWEAEACIWFSIPPQEAKEVEHRKVVLSWVNITRKNNCSVLSYMELLEKSWDTMKAVFSVAAQSSECSSKTGSLYVGMWQRPGDKISYLDNEWWFFTITENKYLSLCNVQCNLSRDIILITWKLYETVSADISQVNCAIPTNYLLQFYNTPASC